MAIDYRKRICDAAESYLGTMTPLNESEFIYEYHKWADDGAVDTMPPAGALFLTFISRLVGIPTTTIPNFSTFEKAKATYTKRRAFYPIDSDYIPLPGDFIFYEKMSEIDDPMGVVVEVDDRKVYFIEAATDNNGNYIIRKKSYMLTSEFIYGYAAPDYDGIPNGFIKSTRLSLLVKAHYIKEFQKWINKTYKTNLGLTGIYDKETKIEVISAWQKQMNKSKRANLIVDGLFGTICKKMAEKWKLKQRSSGNMVYIAQGLLYSHGYDPKYFNGRYTIETEEAVRAFQKARSIPETSGIIDSTTWHSLLDKW